MHSFLIQSGTSDRIEPSPGAIQWTPVLQLVPGAQHLAGGNGIGIEISATVEVARDLGAAATVVDGRRRPRTERPRARWANAATLRENCIWRMAVFDPIDKRAEDAAWRRC